MTHLQPGSDDRIEVAAAAGRVIGLREDGVAVFRGIRYAEPPRGDLRFAPPVDAAPVEVIDATTWGAVSLQDLDPLPRQLPGTEGYYYQPDIEFSEDCLQLNVWAPPEATNGAPVLVWFHGGGFVWGSGTGPWVDGSRFAREQGLVVVTVTYRLGLLGNLWFGDIDPQNSDLGLQDQTAALRWVSRNIAAFGGDPERVTIMGQSAGGLAACAHLVAPGSRGLFHGAVVISGHLGMTPSVADATAFRARALAGLSVDSTGDVLAQLRSLSTARILQVQRELGLSAGGFPLVADGVVMPAVPLDAVRRGDGAAVPLLLGFDAEENRLWSITDGIPAVPARQLLTGLLVDEVLTDQALALYADLDVDSAESYYPVINDQAWAVPSQALADAHATAGNPVFAYEFVRESPVVAGPHSTRVGAAHLSELPFFFGNLDAPGVPDLLGHEVLSDPALRGLADRVSATIAAFVRTGTPDGGPLGAWPATKPGARVTMVIGEGPDAISRAVPDRHAERTAFWTAQTGAASLLDLITAEAG
ncbi:MAG: carboxylesterase family protein [Pseudolysinimonas sp.]|uniref:carboxylesterase/lipase family protein n=1 Tax=Pseudolysinimonas sp. TaxID=2680009 RepID=UPI0032637D2F